MSNKILVVEDEPDLVLVIVERLKTAGYDVASATNGREALEQIKRRKPDLIITDVIMPELDGFGLFKELQKNSATAKIPVIVLTARGKMSDTFAAMGVADFLAKPFDDKVLLATVIKHLPSGKPAVAAPPAPAPVAETPKAKPPATGKKAVIAGIDEPVMKSMAKQLTDKGYDVEVIADCLQVFTKVGTILPQILLIEIPLEDIAAQDVVKVVRGLPKCAKIPILLYSFYRTTEGGTDDPRQKALSVDAAKEECLEAGATEYLGSYTEKDFLRMITKFL